MKVPGQEDRIHALDFTVEDTTLSYYNSIGFLILVLIGFAELQMVMVCALQLKTHKHIILEDLSRSQQSSIS